MPFLGSAGSTSLSAKVNRVASWNTAAGSLLTTADRTTITNINLSATQSDGLGITYSISSGSLPTGLSMNSSGVISGSVGTLSSGQTFNFTIRASSVNTPDSDRSFSITCTLRPDGSDANHAGTSAATIKANTGTTTNGYYWISLPTAGATQVYCDMSGSTAWMLAMRATSADTTFGYNAGYWTNNIGLNDSGDPTTAINIKNNNLWQNFSVSNIRLTASTAASSLTSNPTTSFGTFGATLNTIFNGGNNNYNTQVNWGRANWISWANSVGGMGSSPWDNQPNCNEDRINSTWTYHSVRIGISFNNEGDCNTNDSGIGIGQWRNGLGDRNGYAIRWNPDQFYDGHTWLWVN